MKVAILKDENTEVQYCCPLENKKYLISLGYVFVKYCEFDKLSEKCKKMLSEFLPNKNFDFIKNNWLPIFTTRIQQNKFDKQMKNDCLYFENELKSIEFWNTCSIKNSGYLKALVK